MTKKSTLKSRQDRSNHAEDKYSLRDLIDDSNWNEDEERFFEIIMT